MNIEKRPLLNKMVDKKERESAENAKVDKAREKLGMKSRAELAAEARAKTSERSLASEKKLADRMEAIKKLGDELSA
ncbi:MAG: hypothetical protein HZA94_02270 [Candidatus Vogelbacteria bacterium]|nr:hypothetical protein [Candidatus Vogelbacteria bacterium]